MKFRIIERALPRERAFFKPQYKTFLFWYSIGGVEDFTSSFYFEMEENTLHDSYTNYVRTRDEAKEIIKMFKKWCKSQCDSGYKKEHIVE